MPTSVKCPNCYRALRLPDELVGKRVKCPACSAVFSATAEANLQPSGATPQTEELVPRKRPPEPEDEEELAPLVRKKAIRPPEEEDEEQSPEEEEEYEERPRRKRRCFISSRQKAWDAVAAPAIALIVLGSTYICVSILLLVLHLIGISIDRDRQQQQQPADPAYELGSKLGQITAPVVDIVGICLGGIILLGGFQMKGLKSYGYTLTAIVAAMLPCHCCFLLGVGFGIWALVVINRPEIKSSFG